jgi:hypothetical protein
MKFYNIILKVLRKFQLNFIKIIVMVFGYSCDLEIQENVKRYKNKLNQIKKHILCLFTLCYYVM